MFGIEKEISVFLQAILAGNMVCLVYCVLRVFRRIVRHNLFFISLEDILFWVGAAIFLFVQLNRSNQGEIRWHFVAGVIAGGSITYYFVEKITKKYVAKFHKKR